MCYSALGSSIHELPWRNTLRKATFLLFACVLLLLTVGLGAGCRLLEGPGGDDVDVVPIIEGGLPSSELLRQLEEDSPLEYPTGGGGLLGGAGSAVSGAAAGFLGSCVKEAVVGIAGEQIGNVLKGWIGIANPSAQMLAKLDAIQTQLDSITLQVQRLSAAINQALVEIGLTRDAILGQLQVNNIKPAQDVIEADFQEYQTAANHYSDAQLAAWADQILANHDLPLKLTSLHRTIVGGTVGDQGFLRTMTDSLINKFKQDPGTDVYQYYLPLEQYFGELLTVQFKGLTLMTEAQGIKDKQSGGSIRAYIGTAGQYRRDTFVPNVERQLELFMQCVDRLVLCKGTPNTGGFFRGKVHENSASRAYTEADKLRAQISQTFSDVPGYTPWPWGRHAHVFLHPGATPPQVVDLKAAQNGQLMPILQDSGKVRTAEVEPYVQVTYNQSDLDLRDLTVHDTVEVRVYHEFTPVRPALSSPLFPLLLAWPERGDLADWDTLAIGPGREMTYKSPFEADEVAPHAIGSVALDGRRQPPSGWNRAVSASVGYAPTQEFMRNDSRVPAPGVHCRMLGRDYTFSRQNPTRFAFVGPQSARLRFAYGVTEKGKVSMAVLDRREQLKQGTTVLAKIEAKKTIQGTVNNRFDRLVLAANLSPGAQVIVEPAVTLTQSKILAISIDLDVTIGWTRWEVDATP